MIEKTATRVLDGATITRQSGRGRLVVVKGPDRGETIAIAETPVTVGSGGGCDVLLSDPTISRKHLGIEPGPAGLVLRDLGSTNGSFVQGSRFNELTLGFGTEVTIGKTVLKYLPTEEEVDLAPSEKESYGSLVGRDPKLRRLFRVLDDVAATEATVLIEGETGTGKELLAEEIHRHSPRKDGPFIVFDCGAVPDELIESALFGHVRGAFTGAITDRPRRVRGGRRRHAVPRRDRRAGAGRAARAAARAGQAVGAAGGRLDVHAGVGARRRRHQPQPARGDRGAAVSRGPLLSRRGRAHVGAAAARTPRRHPAAGAALHASVPRRQSAAGDARGSRTASPPRLAGQRARAAQRDRTRLRVSHGDRLELEDALDERPAAATGWTAPAVDVDLPFKEAKARIVEAFERDYIQALLERHKGNLSAASRGAEIDRKHLRELLRKHGLRESGDT